MKSSGRQYTNHFCIKFNHTIIKIINPFFWSYTQHHGSNDVNKVMTKKKNQPKLARKYSQNDIIFDMYIYRIENVKIN